MSTMTKELFRDFFGVPVVLRDFLYRFDVLIREGVNESGPLFEVFQKEQLIGIATTLECAKEIVWTRCQAALEVSDNGDGTASQRVASTLPAPPPDDVNATSPAHVHPDIEVADPFEVDLAHKAQDHDFVLGAGAEERVVKDATKLVTDGNGSVLGYVK